MFNIDSVIKRTLIYFPVFKLFINHIKIIENSSVQVACTTGNTIYYNASFFETLTKDEQVAIMAHELMHILLKHLDRQKERDLELWNYATDAVINQILKTNGLPLVDGVIDCPDALSFSAEEYYDIVKAKPNCDEILGRYRDNREQGLITSHDKWNEDMLPDEVVEDIKDINEHNITEVNKKIIHDENETYTDSMKSQESSSNLGSVGNAKAVVDWKTFLQNKKRKITYVDYNLFNGSFNEEGFYKYPVEAVHKTTIEIVIDTSGSVDDELVRAFLREIKNIFAGFTLKVGCFDTKFYGFQEIKKKEDLDNFPIVGRGGTDFQAAVSAFSKKATVRIIFTDGDALMPKDDQGAIWLVYGGIRIKPPSGQVFYVNPNTLTLEGKQR